MTRRVQGCSLFAALLIGACSTEPGSNLPIRYDGGSRDAIGDTAGGDAAGSTAATDASETDGANDAMIAERCGAEGCDPNCSAIFERDLNATSGFYTIDPDGDGPIAPLRAYCDMDTDGGGWTLVLNYFHKGGTNPPLASLGTSLPVPSQGARLGDDGSGSASWGHANNALFAALAADEVRFFARTAAHGRVIHFVTHDTPCIAYLASGIGTCSGIYDFHRTLPDHSATILERALTGFVDKGEEAMTDFPFYVGKLHHWGVRGNGTRWEVDDFPNDASQDTVHQAWVRTR